MRTDAEAIAASLEQPDEFVTIFDRHFQAVYRFLARRFGAAAASDLAAETFTRAFAGRARYRTQAPSALPWLLGVATRVGAGERRREARQLRAYASLPPGRVSGGEPAPPDDALLAGLRRLKPGDRDALLLFVWGELEYAEIAEALDIPVGTVRSRINRARGRLRDALSASPAPLVPRGDQRA